MEQGKRTNTFTRFAFTSNLTKVHYMALTTGTRDTPEKKQCFLIIRYDHKGAIKVNVKYGVNIF